MYPNKWSIFSFGKELLHVLQDWFWGGCHLIVKHQWNPPPLPCGSPNTYVAVHSDDLWEPQKRIKGFNSLLLISTINNPFCQPRFVYQFQNWQETQNHWKPQGYHFKGCLPRLGPYKPVLCLPTLLHGSPIQCPRRFVGRKIDASITNKIREFAHV